MKQFSLVILLLVSSLWGIAQQQIFISTNGKDSNTGSIKAPVASLTQALEIYRASGKKGGTEILFREGVYRFVKTVELKATDSGKDNSPLVIKSYGNESVELNAGSTLMLDWKPYKKGIYKAEVKGNVAKFEQFYVNGKQQVLARYPNFDASISPYNGWAADAIEPSRLKKLKGLEGVYYHVIHSGRWGGFHYRITGVDKKGNATLEGGWQNNRPENGLHKQFRMIENTLAELDSPNEWYFDGKYIYYYPESKSDLKAVYETDGLSEIISLKGNEQNPVKYVNIHNLTLTKTERLIKSVGNLIA